MLASLSLLALVLTAGPESSPVRAARDRCEALAESGDPAAAAAACGELRDLAAGAGDRAAEAEGVILTGQALDDRGQHAEAAASYARGEALARAALADAERSGDRDQARAARSLLGYALFRQERIEEALEALRGAREPAQESGDLRAQAEVAVAICRSLVWLSRAAEALPTCQEALALARKADRRLLAGYAFNNMGRAQLNQGRAEDAARTFRDAIVFHREAGERKLMAEEINNLGAAQWAMGRFDEAIASFEESRAVRHDLRDFPGEAAALSNLGSSYVSLGRLEAGLAQLDVARGLFRQIDDRRSEGIVLTNMGTAKNRLGRAEEALLDLDRSLALLRAVKDLRGEARCLNTMGKALEALSRFEEALARYQEALAVFRAIGDRQGEGATLGNLGSAYENLGQSGEAAARLEASLAIAREVKDRQGEAVALRSIGLARENQGEAGQALELYQQALSVAREVNDRREVGIALGSAARALETLGRGGEADGLRAQSLAIAREVNDRRGEGLALQALGDAALRRGDAAAAAERHGEALAVLRQVKDRTMEGVALQGLMADWAALRQPVLAAYYGKLAVNAFQEVRDRLRPLDRESRRAFLARRAEAYHLLADLLLELGRLPEAQQVLALVKSEEYGRYLRWEGASERLALTAREAEHAQRQAEASQALAALGDEESALRRARNRRPEEESRLASLPALISEAQKTLGRRMLEARDDFGAARDGPASSEALGLAGQGRELGPGAAALYTLVTPERYRVLLVAPGIRRARSREIGRAELARRVLGLRTALQDPAVDPRAEARALYEVLIGPVAADLAELRPTTLAWSLDGVLRYVPVAALHDGERYLVERYRLAVLTPAADQKGTARPARPWSAWGFGVSRAMAEFPALPGVRAELGEVVRSKGAGRGALPGDVLLDGAFTRDALWRALSSPRAVIHIASHFQFQPGASSESFLLLGDGGHLTLDEISRRPRLFEGVDVLTLSACDTALVAGQSEGGELEGFGALAQRQGAGTVLATLWPVDDESTRRLMGQFYRRAGPGRSKAEALRQAQLALLRGEGVPPRDGARRSAVAVAAERAGRKGAAYAHPYYWAPFVLMGDGR